MKSMTAYGRAIVETELGEYLVEIHSVNRKNLEMQVYLPRHFLQLEIALRKKVSSLIQRGHVTLRITKHSSQADSSINLPNTEDLQYLKKSLNDLGESLGYQMKDLPFTFLLETYKNQPLDKKFDTKKLQCRLEKGIEIAGKDFDKMRSLEGDHLAKDFALRLSNIEKNMNKIASVAPEAPEKYREKLLQKLSELQSNISIDEDRIAKEMIFFADRIDITEELVRLGSHIEQFKGYFSSKEEKMGKTLEFLIQEMQREANTICSKSQGVSIVNDALSIKSEIEKIKEQVLNIQ